MDLCDDHIESMWAEILLPKSKPILVWLCYRPQTDTGFFEIFEDTLSRIQSDLERIILGDFNAANAFKTRSSFVKNEPCITAF